MTKFIAGKPSVPGAKTLGSGRKKGTPNKKPLPPITVAVTDIESIKLRSGIVITFSSQTEIII